MEQAAAAILGTGGELSLTPVMIIIVAIGVFMGSFMDAIAGGGGIITVPTYLLTGIPAHIALGTNKLSSCIGTSFSTARYIKHGYVDWKLGGVSILLALIGSVAGMKLQLLMPENYLQYLLLILLPIVAFITFRKRSLPEKPSDIPRKRQMLIVWAASLVIGIYDGFYGPGTGTFLLLIFCNWAGMDVRTAGGNMKIVNLASNLGAVFTALMNGTVFIVLGLIGAVFSITGHTLGSKLAIKNGSRLVRPMVIVALVLLTVKVITGLIGT